MSAPLPWILDRREAVRLGITDDELRGPGYRTVRRGARVPAGVDVTDPDVRIAAVVAQLPAHAVVGGWAAARLHERAADRDDLVVFDGGPRWDERGGGRAARVQVCPAVDSRLVTRDDVRILRSVVPAEETTRWPEVAATSPLRTAFDLGRLLPQPASVIALDRMLHLGLVDPESLLDLVLRRQRWLGRPRALAAVRRADGGAASPQETLLRLLWCDSGLGTPLANVEIRDPSGVLVARVDLLDVAAGVVGEYDGAVHATSERRRSDAARQEVLEELGLVTVRATAEDVATSIARAQWERRLRAAYQRAARRPASRRRWVVDPSSGGASSGRHAGVSPGNAPADRGTLQLAGERSGGGRVRTRG